MPNTKMQSVQGLKNCRWENTMPKSVRIKNSEAKERVRTLQAEIRKHVNQARKSNYQQVINTLNRKTILWAMKWLTSTKAGNSRYGFKRGLTDKEILWLNQY